MRPDELEKFEDDYEILSEALDILQDSSPQVLSLHKSLIRQLYYASIVADLKANGQTILLQRILDKAMENQR